MTLFDDIQNEIDAGIEDIGFPTEGYHHIMKASEMIDELQERYAPTVEMTDVQYKILVRARNNAVNRVDKVGLLEFMSAYSLLNLEIDHLSLMQAWLHPETIKIVDE